jgi:hypothetical protein
MYTRRGQGQPIQYRNPLVHVLTIADLSGGYLTKIVTNVETSVGMGTPRFDVVFQLSLKFEKSCWTEGHSQNQKSEIARATMFLLRN